MPQGHTVRREPSLGLYQAHTRRARASSPGPKQGPSFSVTGRVHLPPGIWKPPFLGKKPGLSQMALKALPHREELGCPVKTGHPKFGSSWGRLGGDRTLGSLLPLPPPRASLDL